MGKEDERLLAKAPEQNFYLPVPSEEVRGLENGSLPQMLAQTVRDLDALPFFRSPDDLPEAIKYLRNSKDGILIMVRRKRPTGYILKGSELIIGHTYGYFAEAYEEENGVPQHRMTNPSTVWRGSYEPVNISDQGDYHDAGLTPTNFTRTRGMILGLSRKQQLALPKETSQFQLTEGEKTGIIEQQGIGETGSLVDPEEPIIANVFDVANTQATEMERVGQGIKDSIREKFIPTSQGMSSEVGLAHLVITDEGDHSDLLPLSSKLGLKPQSIPFWKMTRDISPYVRHVIRKGGKASEKFPLESVEDHYSDSIRLFKEEFGTYPMVVTLDTRSLALAVHQRDFAGAKDRILYHLAEETMKHPLFNIIEISEAFQEDASGIVKRQSSGRYLFKGENINDIQGLLVKIGVDYALTKQVRGLSILVPALGEVT